MALDRLLTAADNRLLNLIQEDIPLTKAPWSRLGEKSALPPTEVLARITRFRAEGLIRRLGGVFDSHRLGYRGALCAFRLPAERAPETAAVINAYEEVTHNYIRRHEYNMWCTLLAPGEAELARLTEEMRLRVGADKWLNLPARRYFKVRVHFPVGKKTAAGRDIRLAAAEEALKSPAYSGLNPQKDETAVGDGREFTNADRRLISALQEGLPLTERPYADLGAGLRRREDDVLAALTSWRERGILKRVAAILRHRLIGYKANALAVWRIPPERVEQVGIRLAAQSEVTHCYERTAPPEWPYNLYTMLHARRERDCRALARELAVLAGTEEYELLFSVAELKKSSLKYFASAQRGAL
jgi:DNA-binding Lrp family transcriptional regulator